MLFLLSVLYRFSHFTPVSFAGWCTTIKNRNVRVMPKDIQATCRKIIAWLFLVCRYAFAYTLSFVCGLGDVVAQLLAIL